MDTNLRAIKRVLYHHRTQGKAVEGVHIRGVTDALRGYGAQVDIISLPGADPYAPDRGISPTRQTNLLAKLVVALPEPFFELVELAYNAVVAWRVSAYLRRHPDVAFIYERYSLYLFATTLVARWRRIPIIIEVNDSAVVKRVRPLYFARLARAVERWVFSRASGLVFISSTFRDRVAEHTPAMAPAIVTPNAADINSFTFTPEQRAAARAKWGLDGSVVCGYLGAFVPWHAIDRFVYRMAEAFDRAPHLKLLLVGDGATFDAVASFVKARGLEDRIVLTGRVKHAEVPGLLAAMDLAVLPSAGDYTSPVKLFEFMACGVPPVAPDFGPIREVVADGETGWLFSAEDLEKAVDTIIARSQDEAALTRVGRAAREYIRRERQWSNNAAQLIEFHQRLANAS